MKVGVLYSGGKDSNLAMWMAKKEGHEVVCLITIESVNKESYMFHTPSISKVSSQAESMKIPLITAKTKGEKEKELKDLKEVIEKSIKEYGVKGIVTGALMSKYQESRIGKICNELGVECLNPLWQKDQAWVLRELIRENFEVIIVGVAAYPLGQEILGRKIDEEFVKEMEGLNKKYEINVAGEGGEIETFVLNSPMFKRPLEVVDFKDYGEEYSWRREIVVK